MRNAEAAAVLLLSLLIWSCGEDHGGTHAHSPEPVEHEADTHETGAHEPATEGPGLMLNAGQKWQMDDHTRSMFATMVERLEGRSGEDLASQDLGKALETDLDALIQGCTMTGDAHAELHKFLVEFIPAIQGLAAAGGDDEAQEVTRLLALYPQYFE